MQIISSFRILLTLCFLIKLSLQKRLRLKKMINLFHKLLEMQGFEICFPKAVENLKIMEFEEVDAFPEKLSYPIFAIFF